MSHRKWGPNWEPLHEPGDDQETAEPKGLECPRCGCRHFEVIKTSPSRNGYIVRRRECRHCGHRLTTTERIVGKGDSGD